MAAEMTYWPQLVFLAIFFMRLGVWAMKILGAKMPETKARNIGDFLLDYGILFFLLWKGGFFNPAVSS